MADRQNGKSPQKSPHIFQVIGSVLSAFIGIQSGKNRERDFKHGKPWHFIVTGIVLTVIFVLIVITVVRVVISSATGQ
jgi:hypothetical protein